MCNVISPESINPWIKNRGDVIMKDKYRPTWQRCQFLFFLLVGWLHGGDPIIMNEWMNRFIVFSTVTIVNDKGLIDKRMHSLAHNIYFAQSTWVWMYLTILSWYKIGRGFHLSFGSKKSIFGALFHFLWIKIYLDIYFEFVRFVFKDFCQDPPGNLTILLPLHLYQQQP